MVGTLELFEHGMFQRTGQERTGLHSGAHRRAAVFTWVVVHHLGFDIHVITGLLRHHTEAVVRQRPDPAHLFDQPVYQCRFIHPSLAHDMQGFTQHL